MKKIHISRHFLYAIADFMLCAIFSLLSFMSRFGWHTFLDRIIPELIFSLSYAAITVLVFFIFKVYKIVTKEIGISDSLMIMITTAVLGIISTVVLLFIPPLIDGYSIIFTWLLSTALLIFLYPSIRIAVRVLNLAQIVTKKKNAVRTIIIGASASGKIAVDESRRNVNNHNKVVAFVDDSPLKIGGFFAGVKVEGPISNIAKIIEKYNAKEVIIAMNNISSARYHEIIELLNECPVRIRRMPQLTEMQGPNDKKIIDVDLDDLLLREPVKLDNNEIKEELKDKVVMVTGAGGSIGSELVRQIYNVNPKQLILFDIYENSTYDIQMELLRKSKETNSKVEVITLIGSTYDSFRVEYIIKTYKPDYIYHAAAYKHVPLMEDSPAEAIRTNVIGTYNVAKMADKYKVNKMVLVSTDKAVRPTNVMGATKRFAETIIQYYSEKSKNTKYAAVRFGNVLGSNGSVVPLFKKQIEAGGPITITDKEIIRYFMTIPEAVSLILQCGLFAEGGEIFILDMGKPVKILSLAEKLIKQAGLVPYVDIDIIETGLRPGEKLYEELLLDVEHQKKTSNNKIYIEEKEGINSNLEQDVLTASKAFSMEETKDVKELLHKLISTYSLGEKK